MDTIMRHSANFYLKSEFEADLQRMGVFDVTQTMPADVLIKEIGGMLVNQCDSNVCVMDTVLLSLAETLQMLR
jgi:hypothetical protein